jgi:predicted transcriptional regulator
MKVERIFTRKVMATTRGTAIVEAAAAMRRYGVGSLLVLEDASPASKPVGIVTDRDLAMEGFTAESFVVGEAMTPVVATVRAAADVLEALELMRVHRVRRLVVTGDDGGIEGIVSIDDIVSGLSVELAAAAAVLEGEQKREASGIGEVKVGG